jgi:hypothetical protein
MRVRKPGTYIQYTLCEGLRAVPPIGAVIVEDSRGIKARIQHGLWNFRMSIILHNPSIIAA